MLERILKIIRKICIFLISFLKKILFFLKSLIVEDKKEDKSFMNSVKNIFVALIIAVIVRSFLYEPFHIPSGSMKPNLIEGDFIFVSKYEFGYSRYSFPFGLPLFKGRIFFDKDKLQRGDVIVFRLPKDPKINYIKRLVGLPGDRIQIIDSILYINDNPIRRTYMGQSLEYENDKNSLLKEYEEKIENKTYLTFDRTFTDGDNTSVFVVPERHYFFLGDNRDNSVDSRFLETGFVPEENLIGKAKIIFLSVKDNLLKFWKWHKIFRTERMFKEIN